MHICFYLGLFFAALPADQTQSPKPEAPIVAGYSQLKASEKIDPSLEGELLLAELNCVSCHQANDKSKIVAKGAPKLERAGARITPQYLRQFLAAPHEVKPGTTMPDVLRDLDADSKSKAVEQLTHFLASLGGPMQLADSVGGKSQSDHGNELYHFSGCVACHSPVKEKTQKIPSVPLGKLEIKTTVDELAAFLLDPLQVRPGGRMPNMGLSKPEAHDVAVYLLRSQLNDAATRPATQRGVAYKYFEAGVNDVALDTLQKLEPKTEGIVDHFCLDIPGRHSEKFAVLFESMIHISREGKYRIFTSSDDGSRIYVDSNLVVNYDGVHAPKEMSGEVDLTEGDHSLVVTYFQGGGGAVLKVSWQGPGIDKTQIPPGVLTNPYVKPMVPLEAENFKIDSAKAQAGRTLFSSLGCISCHSLPNIVAPAPAKPLDQIARNPGGGCLADSVEGKLPRFDLSDDQRAVIRAALQDVIKPRESSPAQQVIKMMATMNCFACHRRDDLGGPGAARDGWFKVAEGLDLGDEGRIPPRLTGVGAKLQPQAIESIVFDGKFHVRPYMDTRMPRFNREPLAGLGDAFAKADNAKDSSIARQDDKTILRDGRQLVGTRGLGCVNCHGVGHVGALGSPAINFSTVHDRLRFAWFRELLIAPAEHNPGTRMPSCWPDGDVALKDLAGGTVDGQIRAIWAYMQSGMDMPLPTGLATGDAVDELVPADEPIVLRAFVTGIGPRTILAGYPEGLNVAFDQNTLRLAKAWRGRFFDAKGIWEARGGRFSAPLGEDLLEFPPGPTFAILSQAAAPWPAPPADDRVRGFHGYVLDAQRRPTLRYAMNGIEIEEQAIPASTRGGGLKRIFKLTSDRPPKDLYWRAAVGKKIESKTPGVWVVDDKLTIKIADGAAAAVRDADGAKQLVVPVSFNNGSAILTAELSW